MRKSKRVLALLWALLLFGFTVYAALDTFVLERSYAVVEEQATAQTAEVVTTPTATFEATLVSVSPTQTEMPEATLEATAAPSATAEVISTEDSYSDGNISITIQEIRAYDSTIYVADVILSSPEYLQTAFAKSVYGRNVTAKTSSIAANANAILAVNGDYYGARESGYVIRNGVLYRSKANRNSEDLVIYQDGSFAIINESQISAQDLLNDGAWNVLSFGPALGTRWAGRRPAIPAPPSASWTISITSSWCPMAGPMKAKGCPCWSWPRCSRTWAPRPPIIWTAAAPPPWSSRARSSTIPPRTEKGSRKGA